MGIITFNGVASNTLGIVVEHPPNYVAPKKDYEVIHVPGRSGDILMDNGSYQNVPRSYDIAIGSRTLDFTTQANTISNWLHSADAQGYARLEDSYEPDFYRMAYYDEETEITNILQRMGRATVNFNCKPQRYFKSGDVAVNIEIPTSGASKATTEFISPSRFIAYPLYVIEAVNSSMFRVFSYEDVDADVNSSSVSVYIQFSESEIGDPHTIYIDCMTQEIYELNGNTKVNAGNRINLPSGFPIITGAKGAVVTNETFATGKILSLKVYPRWWTI